ncbi:MAG: FMN-dependent NADH-azoreductase [Geminicoccaceae bacterium]
MSSSADRPRLSLRVLRVDSSGRVAGSKSRDLTAHLIRRLRTRYDNIHLVVRDLLAEPLPYVDQRWIEATNKTDAERSPEEADALRFSDRLVAEVKAADLLVIGMPIYNFGVPAALKAWFDQIARARDTFRYSEEGPVGLLGGKRAIVIATSGGTGVDTPIDFATPFVRHVLQFIGISDVHVVLADRLMFEGEAQLEKARAQLNDLAA